MEVGEGLEECLRTRIGSGWEDDTKLVLVLAEDLCVHGCPYYC